MLKLIILQIYNLFWIWLKKIKVHRKIPKKPSMNNSWSPPQPFWSARHAMWTSRTSRVLLLQSWRDTLTVRQLPCWSACFHWLEARGPTLLFQCWLGMWLTPWIKTLLIGITSTTTASGWWWSLSFLHFVFGSEVMFSTTWVRRLPKSWDTTCSISLHIKMWHSSMKQRPETSWAGFPLTLWWSSQVWVKTSLCLSDVWSSLLLPW